MPETNFHSDSYEELDKVQKSKVDEIIASFGEMSVAQMKRLLTVARMELDARAILSHQHDSQGLLNHS